MEQKDNIIILLYRGWGETYDGYSWYHQDPRCLKEDYPEYGPHVKFIGAGPESLVDKFCNSMRNYKRQRQYQKCSLERELQIQFTEFCLRQGYYQR